MYAVQQIICQLQLPVATYANSSWHQTVQVSGITNIETTRNWVWWVKAYPIVDFVWFITYIVFLDAKFVNENSPSCHISSNIFARIQVISPTNVDIQAAPKPFRNYQIYSRTPGKVSTNKQSAILVTIWLQIMISIIPKSYHMKFIIDVIKRINHTSATHATNASLMKPRCWSTYPNIKNRSTSKRTSVNIVENLTRR